MSPNDQMAGILAVCMDFAQYASIREDTNECCSFTVIQV